MDEDGGYFGRGSGVVVNGIEEGFVVDFDERHFRYFDAITGKAKLFSWLSNSSFLANNCLEISTRWLKRGRF